MIGNYDHCASVLPAAGYCRPLAGANPYEGRVGEISAGEFKDFIGDNIRLEPVSLANLHNSDELLSFYMGKNTPDRQDFIIGNLRVEKDLVEA